ncbi:hypothetical protein CDL12_07405 [Handroanthus impetiginosus]|uniref:Uncharacterized protein n=1 Tax=Handroanthus impetiginosus TaxID=429701 RepID=A0A2G9HR54_9LAMI|nr:hypothetical protein CDL12_07405 [Handroanthus impetiginosus]
MNLPFSCRKFEKQTAVDCTRYKSWNYTQRHHLLRQDPEVTWQLISYKKLNTELDIEFWGLSVSFQQAKTPSEWHYGFRHLS